MFEDACNELYQTENLKNKRFVSPDGFRYAEYKRDKRRFFQSLKKLEFPNAYMLYYFQFSLLRLNG